MNASEKTLQLPLRVEFTLSERDFIQACELASMTRTKASVNTLVTLPAIGAVLIAFAVLFSSLGMTEICAPLSVAGGVLLSLSLLARFRFRRRYRATVTLRDRQGLVADNSTLRLWSATSNDRTSWNVYSSYIEGPHSFVLFRRDEAPFVAIPKRRLSKRQVEDLRSVFERYCPILADAAQETYVADAPVSLGRLISWPRPGPSRHLR